MDVNTLLSYLDTMTVVLIRNQAAIAQFKNGIGAHAAQLATIASQADAVLNARGYTD